MIIQAHNKTLDISDAKGATVNIGDLKRWGDPDMWKLLAKASSNAEGWMKSTKAMEIPGVGTLVQVSTQQGDKVAEALTFVPFTVIIETTNQLGEVVERRLAMPEMPYIPDYSGVALANDGVIDV